MLKPLLPLGSSFNLATHDSASNFILAAPNVRFNRNYWVPTGVPHPHLSYDISILTQEENGIWHELMVSEFGEKRRHGSLSVSMDLINPKEVKILKEVLIIWSTEEMKDLEILFKVLYHLYLQLQNSSYLILVEV
ncbi:unnamed protein product [Microthlaspi erraticum]|uniref:Uncharacterized protein n=1 Tax=Microthlaspi erraticum TaxID=1685480 RepID=A0A6D2J6H0_9BRAS|nr:unnamed protein product [Microthlaspi erraticum]CAA7036232.1 unnamed protein product [Microthlaspi erraticum]